MYKLKDLIVSIGKLPHTTKSFTAATTTVSTLLGGDEIPYRHSIQFHLAGKALCSFRNMEAFEDSVFYNIIGLGVDDMETDFMVFKEVKETTDDTKAVSLMEHIEDRNMCIDTDDNGYVLAVDYDVDYLLNWAHKNGMILEEV